MKNTIPLPTRALLIHAVTQYDIRESKKPGHNRHALGIYFKRVDEIIADYENGADLRAAIIAGFSGRLADACLRSVGLSTTTKADESGAWFYRPASQ